MKRIPSPWILVMAAVDILLTTGCEKRPASPSGSGEPQSCTRVVSVAPSITEIICALGATNQLVGRSTACDYPESITGRIPVIGEFGIPSMERVLHLKPNMLFFTDLADKGIPERLREAGVTPVHIQCAHVDDVPAAIRSVGRRLGRIETAEKLASSIESRIAGYRARNTPRSHRPRVLVLIWSDPLTAVGRNSFLNELVTLAGAVNVAEDVDRDYFTVSSEWVVTQNPDAIFCFFMSNGMTERSTLESRPGWNGVSAVKTGRIYDHMDNNLILRPGPRMIQGIEVIAARLQQAHEKP